MSHSAPNDLVVELSRDLVTELAPEELPLFRATSQAFLHDPNRMLADQEAKEEMLGFGMGDSVTLITPAVLAVTSAVINFLFEEVTKATNAESASLIQATVRRLFKKFHPEETSDKGPLALTQEQLGQVRSIALKQARQMKLSDSRAKLLADAIAGSLAISMGA